MKAIGIILFLGAMFTSVYSQNFERNVDVDLKGGYLGFASWCDYNSDGFLDVFVTGIDFGGDLEQAVLYKNNGDRTFSETDVDYIPKVVYGDMSWGDFDNNGTLDLIYAGTLSGKPEDNITKIYKNVNNSGFEEISHTLPNLYQCTVEWVDVNNDGLLDIYYQGINDENFFDLGIFQNNGNEIFERVNINIDKIWGSRGGYTSNSAKWADFDNDGLKDIIVAMSTSTSYNLEFYKNLGNFTFQKIDIGLPDLNYVKIAVGDLNQDGFYDIVFTGSTQMDLHSGDLDAKIYFFYNKGNLTFNSDYEISNVGVFWNSLELGDINNDGYLDIIDYGTGGSSRITNLYINNKDNTFSYLFHDIVNSSEGGAALGDYDNDNDLDILYYGRIYSPSEMEVTYVMENKSTSQNEKPSPPDSIQVYPMENDLLISWSEGNDDMTNSSSLNYNLNLGKDFDPNNLIASASLNGRLKIIDLGNMNLNRYFLLKDLPDGNYWVKLQSMDHAYNASLFSDTLFFCFKRASNFLGDSLFVCEGDSIKIDITGDYSSFIWNNGSNEASIYVKDEGYYTVNLIHSDGCISSETVFLKVKEIPEINLGNDMEACQGDTIVLEIPEFDETIWSNYSNENSINISKTGEFWVQVKDSNTCYNSDTIAFIFHPLPEVSLGKDVFITQADTLVLTDHNGHDNYMWNNGSNNDTLIIHGINETIGDKTYWLNATNEFGCQNTDTIRVSVFRCFKGTSNLMGDSLFICEGDSIKLAVSGYFLSYLWDNGSRDSVIYVNKDEFHIVYLGHVDSCFSSESVYTKVKERPEIDLGNDREGCQGDTIVLQINEFSEILWNNNTSKNHINIWEEGEYWVQVKDLYNCYNRDTIAMVFHPLPYLSLGNDTSIIQTDTLVLSANIISASFLWNNGSENDSLIVYGNHETPGYYIYWLKLADEFGCSTIDTILVTIEQVSDVWNLLNSKEIAIYPNPFRDKIVIEFESELNKGIAIRIFNASGKQVYCDAFDSLGKSLTLQLDSLNEGIYIINILNESSDINNYYKIVK